MKIKTIFLDMDDVLNRFTMCALKHVGCDVDVYDDSSFNPKWGFDIIKAANNLLDRKYPFRQYLSLNAFWSRINREVWADTPVSEECRFLIDECQMMVGKENVCILSCPTEDPECLAGKLEWIHKYMPSWLWRQYLIGPQKWMCARPNALLIDDSDKNVEKFRQAGGQALLVPRPWNALHGINAMWGLKAAFKVIKRS